MNDDYKDQNVQETLKKESLFVVSINRDQSETELSPSSEVRAMSLKISDIL